MHHRQRVGAMLSVHIFHFAQSDAMLVCNRPLHGQGQGAFDEAHVQAVCFGQVREFVPVNEQEHMEIAIANVSDDRARQERFAQIAHSFDDALG